MTSGKVFKIRLNQSWDFPSFGGTLDELASGAALNITFTQPTGAYTVRLDLSTVPYKISFTQ